MKAIILAALFILLAGSASADTIWQYTGQSTSDPSVGQLDFEHQVFVPTANPCGCAIAGSLTLSGGVPVLWDFTAGAINLTNLNSSISLDDMAWVGNPNLFSGWVMQITGQGASLYSSFYGSNYEATDGVVVGGQSYEYVQGNHGIWTDPPIGTPEPRVSDTLLLCLMLFALGYLGAKLLPKGMKRS